MDIKQTLMQALKKDVKVYLEQKLEKVRIPCMDYLKENALRIFKEKITEVYKINSDRIQVIDLPLFLKAVKIIDKGPWSFTIVTDENQLVFKTESGEPIYQYTNNGKSFVNGLGKEVRNLDEYWHDPIAGKREYLYYRDLALNEIQNFIKTKFIQYVQDMLNRGK